MRRTLLTAALIAVFFAVAVIFLAVTKKPFGFNQSKLIVGPAVLQVEIADSPILYQRGLSGRKSLEENRGMLFVFSEPDVRQFWMKDMKFPIDIVWIRNDKVVGMTLGIEPEFNEPYTIYESPEPVDKVLEVNSGVVFKLGIKINDLVEH